MQEGSTHVANWNESKVSICGCGQVIWARREVFQVADDILPQGSRFLATYKECTESLGSPGKMKKV